MKFIRILRFKLRIAILRKDYYWEILTRDVMIHSNHDSIRDFGFTIRFAILVSRFDSRFWFHDSIRDFGFTIRFDSRFWFHDSIHDFDLKIDSIHDFDLKIDSIHDLDLTILFYSRFWFHDLIHDFNFSINFDSRF